MFSIPSGGAGKTTISYNGADYLANKKHKKTLLIDCDQSCSLTDRIFKRLGEKHDIDYMELYNTFSEDDYSVKAIFEGHNPTPIEVSENLDFIAGYNLLSEIEPKVKNKFSWKAMSFWEKKNQDFLSKYEYLIIDTHNDETENIYLTSAYLIADKIVAILPVDETVIKKVEDVITRNDLLKLVEDKAHADVIVVGNKFSEKDNARKQFKHNFEKLMVEKPETYVGYFEDRSAMAQAKINGTPITEVKERDKAFLERTWRTFDAIFGV